MREEGQSTEEIIANLALLDESGPNDVHIWFGGEPHG
jgi:hypothetical protein